MNIKFYGGVDEIGGNRILVEDGSTRVFLDYGMSFNRHQRFFEEYLKPRYASTGLKDLLLLHLVHYLPGIYRNDLLNLIGQEPHSKPSIDGVLLSHIHLDHSALISLLDERIPIISTKMTETYANALLDVGTRSLETEICNYKRRPLINTREEPVDRTFQECQSGKEMHIGEITATPFSVDHSVLGAVAYVLRTKSSTIVYTGDLRLNGRLGQQTEKFMEAAAKAEPDIMLCEGTRIDESGNTSEEYVRENSIKTVRDSKGLVIADFAFRDVTRLTTFYEIAKNTERKLVISKRDAYLMEKLSNSPDLPFALPSVDDDNVLIYIDRKDTGRYQLGDYRVWEKPYIQASNAIRAEEVHEKQDHLMIHLTFFDINELVDIRPSPNATYIHSASEPHNEEQVFDEQRLNNWLDYFQVKKYHYHVWTRQRQGHQTTRGTSETQSPHANTHGTQRHVQRVPQ